MPILRSSTGAEFEVGRQYLAPDAANQEVFLAPVELEGFSQLEFERYVVVPAKPLKPA